MRLSHWFLLLPTLLGPVACTQTPKQVPLVEAQPGIANPSPAAPTPPPVDSQPAKYPSDTMGLRDPDVLGQLPADHELRGSSSPTQPSPIEEPKGGTVIARPPQ